MLWFIASALATLAGAAMFNLAVDPHGLYRVVDRAGFNEIKPRAEQAIELFKYRTIDFVRPRTLLLGNSRAEMGWNPEALSTAFAPVANVSIPGRGLGTMVQLADYAWTRSQPGTLFIGAEFFDCLVSSSGINSVEPAPHPWAAEPRSLLGFADRTYLILSDLLSLDTTMDSVLTLVGQWLPHSPHLRRDGFRPAQDYVRIVAVDGARKMFLQREQETLRLRISAPKAVRHADGKLDSCFADLDRLVQGGVRRGQTIHIGTYPYHGRLLEIIAQIGLWPAYEEWKRELLQIASLARAQGGNVTLRDFGAYHLYALELIPVGGRREPVPRWYWESGHFKAQLGAPMLRVMAGAEPPEGLFGIELTVETIESTLAAIRESRLRFVALQPEVVAEIGQSVAAARSGR